MTKQKTTKIAALIALIAIFGSIIGTGVLVIFETYFSSNKQEKTLTQDEMNNLFKNYSGSLNGTGNVNNFNTGVINETLTGTTK